MLAVREFAVEPPLSSNISMTAGPAANELTVWMPTLVLTTVIGEGALFSHSPSGLECRSHLRSRRQNRDDAQVGNRRQQHVHGCAAHGHLSRYPGQHGTGASGDSAPSTGPRFFR